MITLDFWEDLYQMTLRTMGPWNAVFFVILVLLGPFYVLNLSLAVVAMSFDEAIMLESVSAQKYDHLCDDDINRDRFNVFDRDFDYLMKIQREELKALEEAERAAEELARTMEGLDGEEGEIDKGDRDGDGANGGCDINTKCCKKKCRKKK